MQVVIRPSNVLSLLPAFGLYLGKEQEPWLPILLQHRCITVIVSEKYSYTFNKGLQNLEIQ